MAVVKKKDTINLIEQLEGILKQDQYKLSDNRDDETFSEVPVSIMEVRDQFRLARYRTTD